ncbi:hypothetical protein ACWKSP_00055 [Micromonosporaceae bacterium Da 78-11]
MLGLNPLTHRAEVSRQVGVRLQDGQLPERLRVAEAPELYSSFYPDPADWRELMGSLGLAGKARTR